MSADLSTLTKGIPLDPLPPPVTRLDLSVPHAPKRTPRLNAREFRQAVANALRYFPKKHHSLLAKEFAAELRDLGHIYMHRFRPTHFAMRAYPVWEYPSSACLHARCIMAMVMNNLDPAVAQFPHELITYGGNGCVLSNWAQFHLLMYYLCQLSEDSTLVMASGHPQGVFPSRKLAPRMVITNGMVIPNYSSKEQYEKLYAMGVSMYGQMTAGSYCYIGPQGIVHGTTITVMNAGRKYLGLPSLANTGTVYISSGLGGMSGAQGKAGMVCGCVTVIAEVDRSALDKRFRQGWLNEVSDSLHKLFARVLLAKRRKETVAIGFHGNVVDLWEYFADATERLKKEAASSGQRFAPIVELASDQTSLHNPFNGGYYPAGISFEDSQKLMATNPKLFKEKVRESLRRQVLAINRMVANGMHFWDYGNCFLLEASRAGAEVLSTKGAKTGFGGVGTASFRYPSYVQHIMGDIFSLGFGPFRWVCASQSEADLVKCDALAADVLRSLRSTETDARVKAQLDDNIFWIDNALRNKLVVGSKARILYANADGRMQIAAAFNEAIASGQLQGAVVLSRDHHDVSGTDSPFRETSNVYDGSALCADMAVHNFVGDSFRGATWLALHNGGGVGWGEVINGGFGLVLDGGRDALRNSADMLFWDVNNGIARRAWSGNRNALFQIKRAMEERPGLEVTVPHKADDALLDKVCGIRSKL